MTSAPDPSRFTGHLIVSVKTGAEYRMEPATVLSELPDVREDLVRLCNEPLIYTVLFQDRCKGASYSLDDASAYVTWALRGWAEKAYFVFVILDDKGHFAGTIDIRSANTEDAEIGYWAGIQHRGIMTPALGAICEMAVRAGYRSLIAYTKMDNLNSQKVLVSNGFEQVPGIHQRQEKPRFLFRKML